MQPASSHVHGINGSKRSKRELGVKSSLSVCMTLVGSRAGVTRDVGVAKTDAVQAVVVSGVDGQHNVQAVCRVGA